eukprot:5175278-Prymnesium_polylepis.1
MDSELLRGRSPIRTTGQTSVVKPWKAPRPPTPVRAQSSAALGPGLGRRWRANPGREARSAHAQYLSLIHI